ncbi:GerAB/ArcD/ProY family transporter [Paenibacillus sp. GCM10023248]|uniref:GerAB/ArcD/ProY family transporter n=1 Tax=unclassified Paenibacillus TaxID=185978 RepID=UPI002379A64D|nr:GerAB/ArcD/ProY family transporter [Paenibacillus sp. MAHUQ-63]MDD9268357.1 GerAB/ArcD/ProY family transporter [Paenibacillus sp. MAHUQ-63]
MKNETVINASQLFAMIILFELGTALVLPIGMKAEQGAWISVLMALPGGLLLYLVFVYLYRQFPQLILSQYIRRIVGSYIGWPLCLLYISFFIYCSGRNLREAGDLLITASYDKTPLFVIHLVMVLGVIYVLRKGVEVLFRLGEIYLIITLCLGLISHVLILISGVIDLKNLLPLAGSEGWGALFHSAYPYTFSFPFAEVISFTTVLPHLNQERTARKAGLLALTTSGLLLSFTHAVEIAVLGPDIYGRAVFPLLTMIGIINIADFIQRLDAVVMLSLIIGVFFKMTVYAYAAISVASDIFKIEEPRKMVYPVVMVILFVSMMSAWSFQEHGEEGALSENFVQPLFNTMIPILLFAVHILRKQFGLYRSK